MIEIVNIILNLYFKSTNGTMKEQRGKKTCSFMTEHKK